MSSRRHTTATARRSDLQERGGTTTEATGISAVRPGHPEFALTPSPAAPRERGRDRLLGLMVLVSDGPSGVGQEHVIE